jgi:molybdenum cofactor cytidylyltransferase
VKATGIILAAGESRRMGRPKALLPFRGATFVDGLIAAFTPFCDAVIVVTGAHDREIRGGMQLPAQVVWNPDYAGGQLTSLQTGLRAAPPDTVRVLFTLVDHPSVQASTIERLLISTAPFAIPRYEGRRGHPIAFAARLIPEFLALAPQQSARDIRDRYASEIDYCDVADPGILDDIDDPDTYSRLLQETTT